LDIGKGCDPNNAPLTPSIPYAIIKLKGGYMRKSARTLLIFSIMMLCLIISLPAFTADEKKPAAVAKSVAPDQNPAPGVLKIPAATLQRPNFAILSGTISKIDNADPANVKLEIKGEMDNMDHAVSVMPWTNITKVTDVGELKQGEAIRVITRKIEGKEAAMGIVFGKLRPMTPPAPAALPITASQKKEAGPAKAATH